MDSIAWMDILLLFDDTRTAAHHQQFRKIVTNPIRTQFIYFLRFFFLFFIYCYRNQKKKKKLEYTGQ